MSTSTRRRPHQKQVAPPPVSKRPDLALIPLRLFLGVTFTFAGLQKLANPSYLDAHSPTSVQATMLSLRHQSPIGWMLAISSHAPVLVGVLIALGELAVGMATLAGLWVRLTAAGGLLLSLTFFLTVSYHTHPYYYGSDIVFVFAWTAPLIAGAWPGWTVDAWIRRQALRDHDPARRALVLGGAGAATLAVTGGVLAAFTAAIGRALHHGKPATAPPAPPPSKAPGAKASAPGKSLPGKHVANASELPPGRAVQFTSEQGEPGWLLHETDGSYKAFSAVCTHAGCTVQPSGGEFICPCHGGRYSLTTGEVLGGPPPSPLGTFRVTVVNGDVRVS